MLCKSAAEDEQYDSAGKKMLLNACEKIDGCLVEFIPENMVKRQTMADIRSAPNTEEALSRTPNFNALEARTYRKMVSRAMLISGVPFEVLDDNDACSIIHILEVGGKATLPKREVVDCIPDLLKEELEPSVPGMVTY